MVKWCLKSLLLMTAVFFSAASAAEESLVPLAKVVSARAAVRSPWDGTVEIDFDAYVPFSGTTADITVTARDLLNGGEYTAQSLAGDFVITNSGTFHLSWNVLVDAPELDTSSLELTVSATVAEFAADAQSGRYMLLDLSAGSGSGVSYPVTYLLNLPDGGWTDEYKTRYLVLKKLPAGTFTMGTRSTDWPTAGMGDGRLHEVTLTNCFWMGVFETTQRQWELVKGNRPARFKSNDVYACRPVESVNYNTVRGGSWPANAEVDAGSFIGLLRARSGEVGMDIPTEAEWEYACRAGTTTGLNNGCNLTNNNTDASLDGIARYGRPMNDAATAGLDKGTAAVGSYAPNDWGLYDMHGNVAEWCRDWYVSALETAAVTNPVGPATGQARLLRGGSWCGDESYGHPAYRLCSGYRDAKVPTVSTGSFVCGLRVSCACPVPLSEWEGPTEGSGVCAPIAFSQTIPVAVDAPTLEFTTGGYGSCEWTVVSDVAKKGFNSACSGSPGSASKKETTREVWVETSVSGAGVFSFWWKCSCEYDDSGDCEFDHLAVFTNGVEVARIDGETDWSKMVFDFGGNATNVIRWVYEKDTSDSDGEDCGWIDDVEWRPSRAVGFTVVIR